MDTSESGQHVLAQESESVATSLVTSEGMTSTGSGRRCWLLVVRLLVPIVLLSVIFSQVDLNKTLSHIANVNMGYFLVTLLICFPALQLLGAYRWKRCLTLTAGIHLPYGRIMRHYWTGMFLGYFMPASIGWDAYRIIQANRDSPGLVQHSLAVFIEKIFGLSVCAILPFVAWPFVFEACRDANARKLIAFLGICWTGAVVVGAIALCFRKISYRLLASLHRWLMKKTAGIRKKIGMRASNQDARPPQDCIDAALTGRTCVTMLACTIAIRLLAVLGAYFVLLALDQKVSFAIPLFVIPLNVILFLLPISFGSLGVREGVYIVLYGMFGISRDVALAASFLGLLALLFNVSLGGLVMLATSWHDVKDDNSSNRKGV